MNYVITGGCGFIGSCLVTALMGDADNKIRVVDNLSVGSKEQLRSVCGTFKETYMPPTDWEADILLCKHDLRDADATVLFFEGADVVIHMAAMSGVRESVVLPRMWFEHNVVGTFNVLEAARLNGIKKVVLASSGACVGDTQQQVHEEMPMHPISPYGATKGALELLAESYHYSYDMDTVCLRFSNVYGPLSSHKNSLVAKFIRHAREKGKTFNIYGDGKQTRDFIYTDDLVDAILRCCRIDAAAGHTFQLCSGVQLSVNYVAERLLRRLTLDYNLGAGYTHIAPKVGDVRTNWADNTKLLKILRWKPTTEFEDGLDKTLEWFMRKW